MEWFTDQNLYFYTHVRSVYIVASPADYIDSNSFSLESITISLDLLSLPLDGSLVQEYLAIHMEWQDLSKNF